MEIYNPNIITKQNFNTEDDSFVFDITPEQFSGNDTERINAAITYASNKTNCRVICNKDYYIDSAIIIKNNTTLINNGLIRMNSGMRDNMLRAEQSTVGNPVNNIKIKGTGIFQGSDDNWGGDNPSDVGSERWRSIGMLFPNCTNFELEGFTIKNSHSWGICLEQSRFGSIKNIHFDQNGLIPNQDGVNIRRGSHNIVVENISGITADDLVAVTNVIIGPTINYLGNTIYETGKTNFDMNQIVIRNINGVVPPKVKFTFITTLNVYSGGITLLCEDGMKIYDVSIDGVTGYSQINIGIDFLQYWVTTPATVNDMYNISVSNTGIAPIYTNRPIKNSSFTNVISRDFLNQYDSVAFKPGSLNVSRKYHDKNIEYFTNAGTSNGFPIANGINNNDAAALGQISNTIVTSASTLSLANTSRVMYYTYTGSTPATWTIPTVTGNSKLRLVIYNTGTGIVTINTNSGGNDIYDSGALVNTGTVNPGTRVELFNNSVIYIMS